MRLLVDVNIPRFAAVSAYKKVAEQTTNWGHISNTLDLLDFGPPPYERAPRFIRENISFIPALALRAKENDISFFTYDLLEKEYWKMRPAIDWADRDIRQLFDATELPFHINTDGILFAHDDPNCFDRYVNSIPKRIGDQKLIELVDELGENSSRDCVHMWFADYHSLDGFLTMDQKFIGQFNQRRKLFGYKAKAFMPKDVCRLLKIDAVEPEWFTARSDMSPIYEPHRQIPVGDYIFENADAERLFSR
jgi:hypothetical protein